MTSKALIWSILSYAAPIWLLTVSKESIKSLKISQNTVTRNATWCYQRASIDYLHAETQLPIVEQGHGLLCSQDLANAIRLKFQPTLLFNSFSINKLSREKHTVCSRYLRSVNPYPTGGTIAPLEYENIRNYLNHQAIQLAIKNQAANPILQEILPTMHFERKIFYGHTEQIFLK